MFQCILCEEYVPSIRKHKHLKFDHRIYIRKSKRKKIDSLFIKIQSRMSIYRMCKCGHMFDFEKDYDIIKYVQECPECGRNMYNIP